MLGEKVLVLLKLQVDECFASSPYFDMIEPDFGTAILLSHVHGHTGGWRHDQKNGQEKFHAA